jgi:uncharacterized protein (DUF362 family)
MNQKLSRREFFQKSITATAALALTKIKSAGFGIAQAASGPPLLATISGTGVPTNLSEAVKKLLAPLGGMSAFVKKGQRVLLKPNIGFPTPPTQRATTSPELVAAVAKEVLACGASQVLVMDNPVRRPEACLKVCGFVEALKDLGISVILPLSEKFYTQIEIPNGKALKRTKILKEALAVDVHIALPIAKSHAATGFSGALKGMMGLIFDRDVFHSTFDINQAIADLCTAVKPHLTILDGLKVMASDGPSGPGELVTCNTLVAGRDAVAVDALGVSLAPLYGKEVKPAQIKHILLAEELGVGKISLLPSETVSLTL